MVGNIVLIRVFFNLASDTECLYSSEKEWWLPIRSVITLHGLARASFQPKKHSAENRYFYCNSSKKPWHQIFWLKVASLWELRHDMHSSGPLAQLEVDALWNYLAEIDNWVRQFKVKDRREAPYKCITKNQATICRISNLHHLWLSSCHWHLYFTLPHLLCMDSKLSTQTPSCPCRVLVKSE